MVALGEKIKKARKDLKLSQEQLGGKHFTKSYISQIERGLITPSIKALQIIANRLDEPLSSLLGGNDNINIYSSLLLKAEKLYYECNYSESLKLYIQILSSSNEIKEQERVTLYYKIAKLNFKLENHNDTIDYCNKILNLINVDEDIYGYRSYFLLGRAYYSLKILKKCLNFLLKTEEIVENSVFYIEPSFKFMLFKKIGDLYMDLKDTKQTTLYFKRAINISKKENFLNSDVLSILKILSDIYWIKRDKNKTLNCLNELLPNYQYFNHQEDLPTIYYKYAAIYFESGNYNLSQEYLNKLKEHLAKVNNFLTKSECLAYYNLYTGKSLQIDGNIDMAKVSILDALRTIDIDNPSIEILQSKGIILLNVSKFYYDISNYSEALKYALEAEEILRGTELTYYLPELYQTMAKIYIALNRLEIAQRCYDEAFNLLNDKFQ